MDMISPLSNSMANSFVAQGVGTPVAANNQPVEASNSTNSNQRLDRINHAQPQDNLRRMVEQFLDMYIENGSFDKEAGSVPLALKSVLGRRVVQRTIESQGGVARALGKDSNSGLRQDVIEDTLAVLNDRSSSKRMGLGIGQIFDSILSDFSSLGERLFNGSLFGDSGPTPIQSDLNGEFQRLMNQTGPGAIAYSRAMGKVEDGQGNVIRSYDSDAGTSWTSQGDGSNSVSQEGGVTTAQQQQLTTQGSVQPGINRVQNVIDQQAPVIPNQNARFIPGGDGKPSTGMN